MKNTLTRVDAMNTAIELLDTHADDFRDIDLVPILDVLQKIRDQLSKPRTTSDETKAKQAQARKEKTSAERAKVLSEVVTPIRAAMDKNPRTADEIYQRAKDMLPDDWTIAKVRYILTHGELGDDVKSIDNGRNPHTYHL